MKFLGWLEDAAGSMAAASLADESLAGGIRLADVRESVRGRLRVPGRLSMAAGMEVLDWNLARGAHPEVERKWRAVLRGEGVTVVTGQQPALLGGPLYTLYKLLTAVALAEEIETSTGAPALAVFWVVGDDADFGEVSAAWLPDQDGSVMHVRDAAVPAGGTLIGMLPAQRQIAALGAARGAAGPASGAPDAGTAGRALAILQDACAAGGDWAGVLAALVFRIRPGLSCLFLDGAHPAIVREQSPWIREAARGWPLSQLLREGESAARKAGYEPALDPQLGERAAFRIGGGRRDPWDGDPVGDDALAPNVVLRPVLQDLLLPNAATVGGPSELRYRSQLGPVYRHAAVPFPPLVARMRAVLLPPAGEDPALHGGAAGDGPSPAAGIPPAEAFRDPDAYIARRAEEAAPPGLLAQAEAMREETQRGLAALTPALGSYDAGLAQLAESVAGKVDFQLQRLREGILTRARQRLLRGQPRLAHWREFVRPRDGEQERTLSLLTPFLLGGPQAQPALEAAASSHVLRLEESRPPAVAVFALPADAQERSRG